MKKIDDDVKYAMIAMGGTVVFVVLFFVVFNWWFT